MCVCVFMYMYTQYVRHPFLISQLLTSAWHSCAGRFSCWLGISWIYPSSWSVAWCWRRRTFLLSDGSCGSPLARWQTCFMMYHIGHRLCFEYLYIFSNTGCRSTTGGGSERCSSPTHLHGWHGGHLNWRSKKTNEKSLCCESFSNLWKLESFR